MITSDFEKLVGQVIGVDLVNGEKLVCKLESITKDGRLSIKKPFLFVPTRQGNEMTVIPVQYGVPLYQINEAIISPEHVIMLLPLPVEMKDAYSRHTSGLAIAEKPSLILPN